MIDPVLLTQIAAFDDLEFLVKFLLQLALPLEGKVGRADDEDALDQTAQLQFADQQTGHDGLAGAGIVGEQEADLGEFEQMVVNRLQLVRQRIDLADRQAEIGVELEGDAKGIGLQAEPQQVWVAVKGEGRRLRGQRAEWGFVTGFEGRERGSRRPPRRTSHGSGICCPKIFDRLVLSPANARKTSPSAAEDAELKASTKARGLQQNLVVCPAAEGRGLHAVTAGGRRLKALRELAAEGVIPADCKVPCLVEEPDAARETSLIENTVRAAMHPADEFAAMAALIDAGEPIEAAAIRFGVTERHVKQRLRLGTVAPSCSTNSGPGTCPSR